MFPIRTACRIAALSMLADSPDAAKYGWDPLFDSPSSSVGSHARLEEQFISNPSRSVSRYLGYVLSRRAWERLSRHAAEPRSCEDGYSRCAVPFA